MLAVLMLVPFNLRHFKKIGGSDYKCCITKCCSIKILFQNTKMIHYFVQYNWFMSLDHEKLAKKMAAAVCILLFGVSFAIQTFFFSKGKRHDFLFLLYNYNGLLFSILQKVSILHGLFSFFLQGVLD